MQVQEGGQQEGAQGLVGQQTRFPPSPAQGQQAMALKLNGQSTLNAQQRALSPTGSQQLSRQASFNASAQAMTQSYSQPFALGRAESHADVFASADPPSFAQQGLGGGRGSPFAAVASMGGGVPSTGRHFVQDDFLHNHDSPNSVFSRMQSQQHLGYQGFPRQQSQQHLGQQELGGHEDILGPASGDPFQGNQYSGWSFDAAP